MTESFDLVREACEAADVDLTRPIPLREGENIVWKANESTVVRIGREGQLEAARRELNVAQWLAAHDFPAVRLAAGVAQPIEVRGRPASFWVALPPHRQGTAKDVAHLLRHLHNLPLPADLDVGRLQPFVRLKARISESTVVASHDRSWLLNHLAVLEHRWDELPAGLPWCVVHGDAWVGNVAVDSAGNALMLDLERAAVGPPEWDLVSTAIKVSSFGWLSEQEYREFVEIYGGDVTAWPGFELLRDIRELRMATYLLQKAESEAGLVVAARFRVECLRGLHGARPWSWTSSG